MNSGDWVKLVRPLLSSLIPIGSIGRINYSDIDPRAHYPGLETTRFFVDFNDQKDVICRHTQICPLTAEENFARKAGLE